MQCHIGMIEQQETVDDRIARVKGSARLPVPYLPLCQWSSWFFLFVNLSKGEETYFSSLSLQSPLPLLSLSYPFPCLLCELLFNHRYSRLKIAIKTIPQ